MITASAKRQMAPLRPQPSRLAATGERLSDASGSWTPAHALSGPEERWLNQEIGGQDQQHASPGNHTELMEGAEIRESWADKAHRRGQGGQRSGMTGLAVGRLDGLITVRLLAALFSVAGENVDALVDTKTQQNRTEEPGQDIERRKLSGNRRSRARR